MNTILPIKNSRGIGAPAILAVLVVIGVIVAAGVLVSKKNSDKDTQKNQTNTSQQTVAATKSVSDVTLSQELAAGTTVLTADQVAKANQTQQETGKAYFTIAGGKIATLASTGTRGVVEWGPTLRKVEGTDLKAYAKSVAGQAYEGKSGVTVAYSDAGKKSIQASDGKKYALRCSGLTATKGGQTAKTIICIGEVQKSSVLVLGESGTDGGDANASVDTTLKGATVNLR